jgi:hypothetical protein
MTKSFVKITTAAAILAAGLVPATSAFAHGGYGQHRHYDRGYDRGYDERARYERARYEQARYEDRRYDARYDDRRYDDRYDRGYQSCGKGKGTTGLIIGAAVGGVLGNKIVGRYGDKTAGAIAGAGVGALAGRALDKASKSDRCR